MKQKRTYGDEHLRDTYRILAEGINPSQSKGYLEYAKQHNLLDKIDKDRIKAFKLRASEEE